MNRSERIPYPRHAVYAAPRTACEQDRFQGFTLVEVMVAATITLLLMGGVVSMFGFVTNKVTQSRSVVEMSSQLRNARQRLQLDLLGVTAPTIPPLSPDSEQGYFEVIEGPMGPVLSLYSGGFDYSVGDNDDILMFTTRGFNGEQFVGRGYPSVADLSAGLLRSPLAEIGWFIRNSILYRRVLLIRPSLKINNYPFYAYYDVSMHQEGGQYDHRAVPLGTYNTSAGGAFPFFICNTLGDLTKRENRYAHQPLVYPYDARFWNRPLNGSMLNPANRPGFGLPTLYESASTSWPFPYYGPPTRNNPSYTRSLPDPLRASDPLAGPYIVPSNVTVPGGSFSSVLGGALPLHGASNTAGYNAWAGSNANGYNEFIKSGTSYTTTIPGFSAARYDDIVMNHVLSFDVKVWDPGAPIFQIQTISASTLGAYSAVLPGDPGYNYALRSFINNPSPSNKTANLSSLGAYVDLNYMYPFDSTGTTWATALEKYARTLYGINSALINPTYPNSACGYNYYFTNNHIGAVGQSQLLPLPWFHLNSNPQSGIWTRNMAGMPGGAYPAPFGSILDTWSTHYEHDGLDNDLDGLIDEGTDGIDNPSSASTSTAPGTGSNKIRSISGVLGAFYDYGVDDASELEAPPPYRYPLRGVQIKIRAFEPDTKQVREVTVVHEFLE